MKILTQKIQQILDRADVGIEFKLIIDSVDVSPDLVSWAIDYSKEFGSAQATFTLHNDGGKYGEGGASKIEVGDVVQFSEWFAGDDTEFKKFYGIVNQRAIAKSSDNRQIALVCLDYIATLQFLDLDLEVEGTKVLVENEVLVPNFLPAPNQSLAHIFNFANNSIANDPLPIIIIRNQGTADEDPQYDGFDILYDNGQLKLGFPLNALNNYNLIAKSYYFYTKGVYVEDALESILTTTDGYGNYLFGEASAAAIISNHLTETYYNQKSSNVDTMYPNYTTSSITLYTTLTKAYDPDSSASAYDEIYVADTTMFPNSGQASINGDVFSWTSKTATTLNGIVQSGVQSLSAHPNGSYVKYTADYAPGTVWYLSYSNVQTDLVAANFTITGGLFKYFDKRFGRIILNSAISTSAVVTCNVNYTFKTLQATGVEINKITFRSREIENRFDAVKKLREYVAPNYVIRTIGDNKIWASYLSQKTIANYTLQLMTGLNYLEDEDLYTRVIFYGKNKNPTNLMYGGNVSFVGTGESYKATATASELVALRQEDNYHVYGNPVSGVGRILANTIKPIVYINEVPVDNTSHIIAGQSVVIEITTRTETESSGGGK